MSNCLISIGISNYANPVIPPLYCASNDARKVVELFELWGIDKSNIITVYNETAKRQNLLDAVRIEPLRIAESIDTLIIYYAGHGEAVTNSLTNETEYYLYCYDSNYADIESSSVNIKELLGAIKRINPSKAFLFIDACYIEIPVIPNTKSLSSVEDFELDHSFFALISTNSTQAYEISSGGVFTSALLRGLAEINNTKARSCSLLTEVVRNELRAGGYPLPEAYWRGNKDVFVLETISPQYPKIGNHIKRSDGLIEIIHQIIMRDNSIACFYGDAMSGKTVLALQLCSLMSHYIYCSVGFYDTSDDVKHKLAQLIMDKLPINTHAFASDNFDAILNYTNKHKLSFTIVIDHAERIGNINLTEIIHCLGYDTIKCVLLSRRPISIEHIQNISLPDLSLNEYNEFVNTYSLDYNKMNHKMIYSKFKSSPQALIDYLSNRNTEGIHDCKNEVEHICKCEGFIDLQLFCEMFNLRINVIDYLLEIGWLQSDANRHFPHESLYDQFKINKNSILLAPEAEQYWRVQYNKTPKDLICNTVVLSMILNKGIGWIEEESFVLEGIVEHCIANGKWDELEALTIGFLHDDNNLILRSASSLAHVARGEVFDHYSAINFADENQNKMWNIINSELMFWRGDFEDSIALCHLLINDNLLIDDSSSVHLNLAINYFFLGEWSISNGYIQKINELSGHRIVGWKLMISGTILAIRGVNFKLGIKELEDSIELLNEANDIAGLAIAYNNIGECYFKCRNFVIAELYLGKGELVATLANDKATLLEVQRNMLLTEINKTCSYNNTALIITKQMFSLMNDVTDKTELMQVYNTLATAEAYNFNSSEMKKYIDLASELTKDNKEYAIYTYINKAIYALINELDTFSEEINNVLTYARIGSNYFAILQCFYDITNIESLYGLNRKKEHDEKIVEILEVIEDAGISFQVKQFDIK